MIECACITGASPFRRIRKLRNCVIAAAAFSLFAQPPRKFADFVLTNGSVYTIDAARTWAEAVAVSNGRILFVGTSSGAKPFIGPATKVVDLHGKMVLPGFADSHVHPVTGGLQLKHCHLDDLATPEAVYSAIREYRDRNAQLRWLLGTGWDLHVFPHAAPRKEPLDAITGDVPAYIEAMDGHSAWANSAALRLAGIDRNTPDPARGHIERDSSTGEPSGTLRESATELVSRHIPAPTAAERIQALRDVLQMAASFGITSLHEADATRPVLDAYAELQRRGELPMRINASLHVRDDLAEKQIPQLLRLRAEYEAKGIRAHAAKLFIDGVIESRTAAMLEPYLHRDGDRGTPNYTPEVLNRFVAALDRSGFQVHMHAIGDRAIRMGLDAFQAALHANGDHDLRHQIAHLELIEPDDIPRFQRLHVLADFQALWAAADRDITEMTIPALGPERSRWLYPIGSVAATGAIVLGGSDWNVSSMNPLDAIQVAVTRMPLEGAPQPAWIPEERTDLRTMLAAYTINGAYLNHQEHETGSIEIGKCADLIVLDRNLFEIPAADIHRTTVLWTILRGKTTYQDLSFTKAAP